MLQVLIAFDQLLNCLISLFIGGGWADETLSARIYRNRLKSRGWMFLMHVVDAIFMFQPEHCKEAYISEVMRKQSPKEERV